MGGEPEKQPLSTIDRVSWGIRYHAPLRFYPDESVGYEYPEMYNRMFGEDYEPEPYIREAAEFARNHPWYMDARLITLNDTYAFEEGVEVSIEPFIDIIGRHFKQPVEGLSPRRAFITSGARTGCAWSRSTRPTCSTRCGPWVIPPRSWTSASVQPQQPSATPSPAPFTAPPTPAATAARLGHNNSL